MKVVKGFTIIELLIGVAILGVMSSIGIAIYSGVTSKTRDGQRIGDLQIIKQALELYRSEAHKYPKTSEFILTNYTTPLEYNGNIYMSQIPKDMDSNKKYFYTAIPVSCNNLSAATACTGFVLCAKKDSLDNTYVNTDCLNVSLVPLSACGGNCDIGISSQ